MTDTTPAVIVVEHDGGSTVVLPSGDDVIAVDVIEIDTAPVVIDVGSLDIQGPPGPPGTDIIAVPYAAWPPADPQPDTLYLRLAP